MTGDPHDWICSVACGLDVASFAEKATTMAVQTKNRFRSPGLLYGSMAQYKTWLANTNILGLRIGAIANFNREVRRGSKDIKNSKSRGRVRVAAVLGSRAIFEMVGFNGIVKRVGDLFRSGNVPAKEQPGTYLHSTSRLLRLAMIDRHFSKQRASPYCTVLLNSVTA